MKINNKSKFYVQTKGVGSWRELLAEPEKQWKPEYSAYELAVCWEEAQGFPKKVNKVLKTSATFNDIKFIIGLPEHQVPLKGGSRPSQNDILVLANCLSGLVSIAVEGKVHETFGELLSDWDKGTSGRNIRLQYLTDTLGLSSKPSNDLRYQLFHRTASAIIEAQRFNAKHAIMLVHTFFKDKNKDSFQDYCNFLGLFGINGIRDQLVSTDKKVGEHGDISLHFAWVEGK